MRRKQRVSYSLSEELISEIEYRRGLTKKSTFVEKKLRKALGLELEEEEKSPSRQMARTAR